jgi:hypothetical protein
MAIAKASTVGQRRTGNSSVTPLSGAELQQEMQAGHEQIPCGA